MGQMELGKGPIKSVLTLIFIARCCCRGVAPWVAGFEPGGSVMLWAIEWWGEHCVLREGEGEREAALE